MSNWVTITDADVQDAASDKVLTALAGEKLADGQTDPTPRSIADVVAQVRNACSGNRRNPVDAFAGTVPASLRRITADLIVFDLMRRLKMPLTDDERKTLERHEARLDRIRRGEELVELPDNPTDPVVAGTAGTPSISNDRLLARQARRSGL